MSEGRLFLSRRVGQRLVIAGNITITILRVRGVQVSLEIRAPKDTPVDREEVHLRRGRNDDPPAPGETRSRRAH
jgi:carbon storage regulator